MALLRKKKLKFKKNNKKKKPCHLKVNNTKISKFKNTTKMKNCKNNEIVAEENLLENIDDIQHFLKLTLSYPLSQYKSPHVLPAEIIPGLLFLSDLETAVNIPLLKKHKITHVVTCCANDCDMTSLSKLFGPNEFNWYAFPGQDTPNYEILQHLNTVLK